MKGLTVRLLGICLTVGAFSPRVWADTISQDAYVEMTIGQIGRYFIDKPAFRNVSHGWLFRTPDRGNGYNWENWGMTFSGLQIPDGSTLNSAMLTWNRTLWEPSWHWDLETFRCKTATGFCFGSTVERVDLDTWSNMVFVGSGNNRHSFSVPEPRSPTGSFDLLAFGLGPDIQATKSVLLLGALQLALGRVYLDEGFNSYDEFNWQAQTRMGMSGRVTINFTPPSTPDPVPVSEPASALLIGLGLVGLLNWKRRLL